MYEIDAALDRIRHGTYGVCEISGEPIEAERLAAIPWTRYSAVAQRELEESGDAARTRLGERGTWAEPAKPESDTEEAEAA
jgi:RNA polymerase-binding transcription factor DksA